MTLAHLAASAGLAWALAVAPTAPAAAQSPLASALEFYAAANYDDALTALDQARDAQPSADDLVTIEQHRLLCLVALGRTAAAQDAVAGLIDARPEFVLSAADASPRVRAVFEAARSRVLPDVARRRYADARRAYSSGDFPAAHDGFARVTALLDDPAVAAHDPAAADLRLLAAEFLQLSTVALERERAPKPPAEPIAIVPEVMRVAYVSPLTASAVLPQAVAPSAPDYTPAAPEPAKFTPLGIFTYDWKDTDVTPPVPLAQPVGGWWGTMGEPAAGTQLGAIEVVVDETGVVTEARIYLSVNRVYDNVLLESVKHWRYRPASKDGRAVKYRRVSGVVSGR